MRCLLGVFWKKINSLGLSDAIWGQRCGSTLAQVMACCLTAPSHYLNQSWLIISKVQRHSSEGDFAIDTPAINHWNYLQNNLSKISFKSSRSKWVNCGIVPPPCVLHQVHWYAWLCLYYSLGCSSGLVRFTISLTDSPETLTLFALKFLEETIKCVCILGFFSLLKHP